MNDPIAFLHEFCPAGYHPQLGYAGADKVCRLWLPGNKQPGSPEYIKRVVVESTLVGTSQLCFGSYVEPQTNQTCAVTHLALDVDDNPDMAKIHLALDGRWPYSVRTSTGGVGLHVFIRLAQPIMIGYQQAGTLVKQLALPIKLALEEVGQTVCQANKRLMWVKGGKNDWVKQTAATYTPLVTTIQDENSPVSEQPSTGSPCALGSSIVKVTKSLGVAAKLGKHQIHIGTVVERLRGMGENVTTRSRCSGANHDVNGFLEVHPHHLVLFSSPANAVIWKWDDL